MYWIHTRMCVHPEKQSVHMFAPVYGGLRGGICGAIEFEIHALTNTYTLPYTYIYVYIYYCKRTAHYVIFYLYINCISYVHIILRKRDVRGPSRSFATYQVTTARFSRVLIYYALRTYKWIIGVCICFTSANVI